MSRPNPNRIGALAIELGRTCAQQERHFFSGPLTILGSTRLHARVLSTTIPMPPRHIVICALALLLGTAANSQTPQTLSVPADSARWDLQGQAKVAEYQGRKCLSLDGGAAVLKDFEMRDAVIDVDVATTAKRGFFGFDFRINHEGLNFESVYLRPHKSGLPDALQYTPVLNTGRNWQIYNGPGFTGAVDIPRDVWFHLRLEVVGAQAKFYVKNHGYARARDGRSENRLAERSSRPGCPDGRNIFFEFRNTDNARRPMGAASAADASRHSVQVELVAFLRCAGTESGAPAYGL